MGVIVYCISFFGFKNWITLLIQVPLGMSIYIGGAFLFKFESLSYCIAVTKSIFKKEKKSKKTNSEEAATLDNKENNKSEDNIND